MPKHNMKIVPDIPRGLGDSLLKRKYGKRHHQIADLLLQKFAIETVLIQEPDDVTKVTIVLFMERIRFHIQILIN